MPHSFAFFAKGGRQTVRCFAERRLPSDEMMPANNSIQGRPFSDYPVLPADLKIGTAAVINPNSTFVETPTAALPA